MDSRLVTVLEKALASGEIGSLFIGQGRKMRQVFLSGNEVYLVDAGREIRFLPLPFVIDGSVVPSTELDIVLGRFGSSPKSLAKLLDEDYDLSDEQKDELRSKETIEEALMILEAGGDRFVFEAGTVPEEVLLPDEDAPLGITNPEFLGAFRQRVHERELIERIFPHPEEMPVLTGEGSSERQRNRQWLFARIADLVDGFRDLRRIRKDGLFFPHLTEKLLAAAVRRNWVRKKRFPEFDGLRFDKLRPEQLADLAQRLVEAIPMAVDEVPLRRHLISILERQEDRGPVVAQLIAVGDQLAGRREWASALESYRRATQLAPRSPEACGRLARLLEHFADEALADGNAETARRHLEEALPLRAHDESIQLRIVQSYAEDDRAAARTAARLAGMLHQDNQGERALRFLRLVLQTYPTSDVIRKTFINFLLDHGMAEQALRELEMLARELLVRGHAQDARQIFEKIIRIDPNRVPKELRAKLRARPTLPPAPKRPRRTRRRRPVLYLVVLALCVATIYQSWLWVLGGEFEQRADAILQEPIPRVGTQEHVELRNRWQKLLTEVDEVRSQHPVQVTTLRLGESLDTWINELQGLEHAAQTYLSDLVDRARLAELRGSVDEARGIYRELARVSADPRWSVLAREKLEELEGVHSAANDLRARSEVARSEGHRHEAFRLVRELVDRYPSAEASAGALLPVRIVSNPSGADIEIDGKVVGTTPLVVELSPYTSIEIRLYHPDYPEKSVSLEDPREPEIEIDLLPAPSAEQSGVDSEPGSRDSPEWAWAPIWVFIPPQLIPRK